MKLNAINQNLDLALEEVAMLRIGTKAANVKPFRSAKFVVDVLIQGHEYRVGEFPFGTEQDPQIGMEQARGEARKLRDSIRDMMP